MSRAQYHRSHTVTIQVGIDDHGQSDLGCVVRRSPLKKRVHPVTLHCRQSKVTERSGLVNFPRAEGVYFSKKRNITHVKLHDPDYV